MSKETSTGFEPEATHADVSETTLDRTGLYQHVPPRTVRTLRRLLLGGATGALVLFYGFPIYWMVVVSLTGAETLTLPIQYVPTELTFAAYEQILFHSMFLTFYWNSIVVAVSVMTISVVASVLAGYGLAYLTFPRKETFAKSILFGYMFPPVLLGIPIYMIWERLGLINSLFGLVLAQLAIILPFSTWIMWNFFLSIDKSFEEAAWLCGASRPRAFFEVALPKAKPGVIAIAIWAFGLSWGDFTFATMLLIDLSVQTLPIGIMVYAKQTAVFWGQMMAAVTLISIPPFIVVTTLLGYVLKGFSVGGMS